MASKKYAAVLDFLAILAPATAVGAVRALAEYRIGTLPLGFDSSYAYVVQYLGKEMGFVEAVSNFNLLYFVFSLMENLGGVDAFLAIKIVGTTLFFLVSLLFGMLLQRVLKLSPWLSGLGVILFGLQLSTLRLSWDLHRNELGITFLFATILCAHSFWQ